MNRELIQTWAHVAVAACAIVGIGLGLYSSRQTAEVVARASEAFRAVTYPMVKFQHYQWNATPPGTSCENPALGFNVYYKNVSGVPISLEATDLQVRMGERELGANPEVALTAEGESILGPGEALATGFMSPDFPDVFRRLQGPNAGPNLNFTLSVVYRSLVTAERYCYTTKIVVLDDCRLSSQKQYQVKGETLGPCPVK